MANDKQSDSMQIEIPDDWLTMTDEEQDAWVEAALKMLFKGLNGPG